MSTSVAEVRVLFSSSSFPSDHKSLKKTRASSCSSFHLLAPADQVFTRVQPLLRAIFPALSSSPFLLTNTFLLANMTPASLACFLSV